MVSKEFPRQFVAVNDALTEWSQIEPYFMDLQSRNIDTAETLNAWLVDWSELAACIDEVGTDRYVKMTCQTGDADRKQAYLDFIENIEPKCKPLWHDIQKKFAASSAAKDLPAQRFEVFSRCVTNSVALYRDENVPLLVEEAKLEQSYQEINGAMTVQYDGEEKTLQQLATYMEGTDRSVRQEVWELSGERRLQDAEKLEETFEALYDLRNRMAANAGMPDYRAYAFKFRERFDYSPEDCFAFHDAVERTCVPLMRGLRASRKEALGVDVLRPWDLAVDAKGRQPLKPFETIEELVQKCVAVFDRVDPALADQFRAMASGGDLDLDSRKGKAPGGYQSTFHESRLPFIFMNAVGLQRDVRTLLHECGHAFHALACRNEPLVQYRSSPIEFAEVASMAMELLSFDRFDVFYSGADLDRAKRAQLEGIVTLLPWVATIDAFQHWLYTHPGHTREERRDHWLSLHARFGGDEDYSGYEERLDNSWHRQLHLFEAPFYYIEYGIAQLGALQVWQNAKRDRQGALDAYRAALALGGSRPLPQLFEAAGIKFDFSIDTLGPLMDALGESLATLGE